MINNQGTQTKNNWSFLFLNPTRHHSPLSALWLCMSMWAYVWKCVCVGGGGNSCDCENDPVSKANCDQWRVDRTVRKLEAGTRASRGPRQRYCASPFIPILSLFSWLSSMSSQEYLAYAVRKTASGQDARTQPH